MSRSISVRIRRGSAVAATCLSVLALTAGPAIAQCGETTNVTPKRSLGVGAAPLAVGDSVLYDAADALSYYGFQINAMVCRTMSQGIVWLEQHASRLPVLVVVALGTNGAVTTGQIGQLLSIVGPNRMLAMVTPHHGNYAYVPGLIRSAAQQHPGRMIVLDWDRLSARHPDWFAPDGIHLGGAAGIAAFARLVAGALLATPSPTSGPSPTSPPAATGTPAAPRVIHPPKPPRRPPPPPPTPPAFRAGGVAWLALAAVEALCLGLVNG